MESTVMLQIKSSFFAHSAWSPAAKPGRPIVSACSRLTEHTSEYIGAVLRPLVELLPAYVKDSTLDLNLIEDSNQNPNFDLKYFFSQWT